MTEFNTIDGAEFQPNPEEPPSRPPESSRERLIEAGWQAFDQLSLAKAFAGVTSAQVAGRAGLTTGSFFHHFSNAAEFTDAMALSLVEDRSGEAPGIQSSGVDSDVEFVDLLELLRTILKGIWTADQSSESGQATFRHQMAVWTHNHAELADPTEDLATAGDILRQGYTEREAIATGVWYIALDKSGREVLSPFNIEILALAITALFEGLRIRAAVDPDAVSDDLFGDIAVAIATSLTGPQGGRPYFDESSLQVARMSRLSPQARSGVRRKSETRAKIVQAATGMFANGWESVSAAEIAQRAGVSNQTVLNLFGGVRAVAAATFAVHGLALYSLAVTRSDQDPETGLRLMLTELIERISVDRQAARAVLSERMETVLQRGSSIDMVDIRVEVPLGAAVARMLNRCGLSDDAALKTASTIVNFVLATSLWGEASSADIVDSAMGLIRHDLVNSATDQRW